MLGVTGFNSTIVQELCKITGDHAKKIEQDNLLSFNRYVFAAGILHGKNVLDMDHENIQFSLDLNMVLPIRYCEKILNARPMARICIIGSESGIKGSYDTTYACAKAGIHQYVRTRHVGPQQQLVAVAPSIIEDSGMTKVRTDHENLAARCQANPKGRFLKAIEVARLVRFLLYDDKGYINNTVIEMNGGV